MTCSIAYSFHYVIRSNDLLSMHTGSGALQGTKYVEIDSGVVEKISPLFELLSFVETIYLVGLRVGSICLLLDSCTSWHCLSLIVETIRSESFIQHLGVVSFSVVIHVFGDFVQLALLVEVDGTANSAALRHKVGLVRGVGS